MKDKFNREITYMRISVTDRCNYRCEYCMPEEGIEKCHHDDIISLEEIVRIVKSGAKYGIKKIRITGGEPLVRKGVVQLCEEINKIPGIEEIGITTNGSLLKNMAKSLREAGVSRINFSIDTLDPDKFSKITRWGKLEDTLEGVKAALYWRFKIKINTVLIGGFNEDDVVELVNLTKDNDIQVRFIELMKIGETRTWDESAFISNKRVLELVPELEEFGVQGVAKTYKVPGYKGSVGLISPVSSCFCEDCNRIRLTSDGKLKPCLHSNNEIDLKNLTDEELDEKIKQAIFDKPKSHHLDEGYTETDRNMNMIGG